MQSIVKSGEADADASSSFSRVPDEIILQILEKLFDFKSLCFCYLVSRRFSSIVLQVDAVAFSAPLINPPIPDKNTVCESFLSSYRFLSKFKGMKSLCIELSPPSHKPMDNRFLFKWKIKFGTRVESFIFLSPSSICDKDGLHLNGNRDEEDIELVNDLVKQKRHISFQCLKETILWHMMLLDCVNGFPKLEEVSISDSGRRGRLSLSGEKLGEAKEWLHSASETELERVEIPDIVSQCYIPVLKLPVSGYVMKGVFVIVMERKDLQGGNDVLMSSEDGGFEDKEEAAYTEAVKEILKKHKAMMLTYHPEGALV